MSYSTTNFVSRLMPAARNASRRLSQAMRQNLKLKACALTVLALTVIGLSSMWSERVSAAVRALVPEVAGIHFISFTTVHVGDDAGSLSGTFAGQTRIFDITATDYDTTKPAIITMRVKEVNSPCNQALFESINVGEDDLTVHVANPIPNHTEDLSDWHTVTLEIPSNTFKAVSTKRLWISARTSDCGLNGELDDFLVDTIVLHYVRK